MVYFNSSTFQGRWICHIGHNCVCFNVVQSFIYLDKIVNWSVYFNSLGTILLSGKPHHLELLDTIEQVIYNDWVIGKENHVDYPEHHRVRLHVCTTTLGAISQFIQIFKPKLNSPNKMLQVFINWKCNKCSETVRER